MAKRLPAWLFLTISLCALGFAFLPILRVVAGLDQNFSVPFLTVVMAMIGGLMSGLTGMILLVRKPPVIDWTNRERPDRPANFTAIIRRMHAGGLLLYCGLPLANFFVCYWLWQKYRLLHPEFDVAGREAVNFQITIYLYLLLSLFMMFAAIGIFTTPMVLALHLIGTLFALVRAPYSAAFTYPANIPIIQGRRPATSP
jgi:uncharacterized Tic20 family protein